MAEQLEFVPAGFRVILRVRSKLAFGCCDAIAQAPAPIRPMERGIAGLSLLASVLLAKFADHLLLYRQSVIYAREDVDLDRAVLANWAIVPGRTRATLAEIGHGGGNLICPELRAG